MALRITDTLKSRFAAPAAAFAIGVSAIAPSLSYAETSSEANGSAVANENANVSARFLSDLIEESEKTIADLRSERTTLTNAYWAELVNNQKLNRELRDINLEKAVLQHGQRKVDAHLDGLREEAFTPAEPTEERPYYTITFNTGTFKADPDKSPREFALEHAENNPDHIVVINYIDPTSQIDVTKRNTGLQNNIINQSLTGLSKRTEGAFLLINVDMKLYAAETYAALTENSLGSRLSSVPIDGKLSIPPYGEVYGTGLLKNVSENSVVRSFDFSIMVAAGHPVTNEELLLAVAEGIYDLFHSSTMSLNKNLAMAQPNRTSDTRLASASPEISP